MSTNYAIVEKASKDASGQLDYALTTKKEVIAIEDAELAAKAAR